MMYQQVARNRVRELIVLQCEPNVSLGVGGIPTSGLSHPVGVTLLFTHAIREGSIFFHAADPCGTYNVFRCSWRLKFR